MSKIAKSATVCKAFEPDERDMALINKQALEPLEAGEVFAFRVAMCDDLVDRSSERFSDEALSQMAAMYVGKTVIKNHDCDCDNQVARIYRCEVEDMGDRKALVGYAYTLDNEANAQFVRALKAGILREVSVSFSVGTATCSICGTNNVDSYCKHWPGREYDGKTCTYELADVLDVYELSFVAVPCQPQAGVVKAYGAAPWEPAEEKAAEDEAAGPAATGADRTRELRLRARAGAAWSACKAAHSGE